MAQTPPVNALTVRLGKVQRRRDFANRLAQDATTPLQAGISGTGRNPIQTALSPFQAIAQLLKAGISAKVGSSADKDYEDIAAEMAAQRSKALEALGPQASGDQAAIESGVDPSVLKGLQDTRRLQTTDSTTRRGQDISASTAAAGRSTTERGQDISASTALRGQDIGATTTRRGQDIGASSAAAGRATTERGQDLSADTAAAGRVTTERGQDKSAAAAQAAAANKPLTEYQSKAVGQLTRMQGAEKKLQELQSQGFTPGYTQKALGAVPGIGNALQSPQAQQYRQAAGEFIAGILRLDSGAAVPEVEFDRYFQNYFPQPGDSQQVITQKQDARQRATDALRTGLGSAASLVPGESGIAGAAAKAYGQKPASQPGDYAAMSDDELKRQLGL